MSDVQPAAIAAATEAIRDAFPGEFGKPGMPEPEALARAALEAATPLLAEAWGVTAGMTVTTEHGIRANGGSVMRPHPSIPGTPVSRTAIYGPWEPR